MVRSAREGITHPSVYWQMVFGENKIRRPHVWYWSPRFPEMCSEPEMDLRGESGPETWGESGPEGSTRGPGPRGPSGPRGTGGGKKPGPGSSTGYPRPHEEEAPDSLAGAVSATVRDV